MNKEVSVKENIAKNLGYYRKLRGMTQKVLSEKLGVNNSAVSNWETGNNSIDIDVLFKACKILDVSLNEMFGASTSPNGSDVEIHDKDFKDLTIEYKYLPEQDKKRLLSYARKLRELNELEF